MSVLAIGDLYQLPPCKMRPIFADFKNALKNLSHPWRLFKRIELEQIMRQKSDSSFSHVLNTCRKGKLNQIDIETLTHRVVAKNDGDYPKDVLHIWAENVYVDRHNKGKLEMIDAPCVILTAKDEYPTKYHVSSMTTTKSHSRSDNGGLDEEIKIKEDVRVMLTKCIAIADRLINDQLDAICKIKFDNLTNDVRCCIC